jgi:asparagine synthase (glutamine-hydrolysing)
MTHDYLTLFCIDHTEQTLWENVDQLLPGHNMRIDLRTGKIESWRYYTIPYTRELGDYNHKNALAYASDVRELLFDAVKLRLRADVPIGTCLSGGLDSSSVVAIIGQILAKGSNIQVPKTFTASYPGEPIDETRFAKKVIERTGAQSYFTFPSMEACWRQLPKLLHHYDEPFGGPSFYAQWEVMLEASKHVKIVVDGQAGDEVFGGYGNYRAALFANLATEKRFIAFAKEFWSTVKNAPNLRRTAGDLRLALYSALSNPLKSKLHRFRYRRELEKIRHISGLDVENPLGHLDNLFSPNLNESLFYSITKYMLPHLLKYEDRNSMAQSIEARVPITDYRLVDYVFSLPSIYKIHNGWSKWLLRLAVKDLLPPEIVWRKDKLGFATPKWASRQEIWRVWLDRNFHSGQEKCEIPLLLHERVS